MYVTDVHVNIPWVSPGASGQLDKIFKAAVGFLEEGSLDARTYGKRIIWQVSLHDPCTKRFNP